MGDYNQIRFSAIVAHTNSNRVFQHYRSVFVQIWQLRPRSGNRDLDFAIVRNDLLSFRPKAQALAIQLDHPADHAHKKRDSYHSKRERDVAQGQPYRGDSLPAERVAGFANLRTSDVAANDSWDRGKEPSAQK